MSFSFLVQALTYQVLFVKLYEYQIQGLILVDFIAVIGLYSQCQKVYFSIFFRKIPNFKSERNMKRNHHFYHGKSWLKTVEYSTLHILI